MCSDTLENWYNLCSSHNNLQNIFSVCDRTANKEIKNDKIDYSDPGHIAELLVAAGVAVGASATSIILPSAVITKPCASIIG